jgi:hypothetical protein
LKLEHAGSITSEASVPASLHRRGTCRIVCSCVPCGTAGVSLHPGAACCRRDERAAWCRRPGAGRETEGT